MEAHATSHFSFRSLSQNKNKIAMHFENIVLQQDSARRTLERILSRVGKDLHSNYLHLVPALMLKKDDSSLKTSSNQTQSVL